MLVGTTDTGLSEPRVRSGQIVAMRLIDVAFAIDLKRAETLWAARAQRQSVRSRLGTTPLKAMSFGVPPLALQLDPIDLEHFPINLAHIQLL